LLAAKSLEVLLRLLLSRGMLAVVAATAVTVAIVVIVVIAVLAATGPMRQTPQESSKSNIKLLS